MNTRREMLKLSASVASMLMTVGLFPVPAGAEALGYNTAAFDTKSMEDLMKSLGAGVPAESRDVTVTGPDIAENGAVVPLSAATSLAGVKRLLILVEKNPNIMTAMFDLTDDVDASVTTRVKMGQSSNVFAVAMMNDGRVLYAQKEVKVTLGGCGG